MARKCKDCDPNKYIEGLSWRGANGYSFDGYTSFNDVGKPIDSTLLDADVEDLLDAFNPVLSGDTTSALPSSTGNLMKIKGIDRTQGFWLVWSMVDGLIMYGIPGQRIYPALILNDFTATARKNTGFIFNILTNQVPSTLTYTDFGVLADTSTSDRLRFDPITTTSTRLFKNNINYVGYFTGYIKSTLNGARSGEYYIARKSLTITAKDSLGNNPIQITSAPTASAFSGQSFSYTITTNVPASNFTVDLLNDTKTILSNLNLIFNPSTKTISGTTSSSLGSEPKTTTLTFRINGPDADAGNKITFSLQLLYGPQDNTLTAPTINPGYISFSGKIGQSFGAYVYTNNQQKLLGISSLPEGLTFNSANGYISGTPKHAGAFTAYVSATNSKGTSSAQALSFTFAGIEENNSGSGVTFPNELSLPRFNYSNIRSNKLTLRFSTNGNETLEFKKINRSEFDTIRKNSRPDGDIIKGKTVPDTVFFPANSIESDTCFWMYIDDPTGPSQTPSQNIDVRGTYDVSYSAPSLVDALGNSCYAPSDNSKDGPASKAFTENLTMTINRCIISSISANPAENVPQISFSPTNIKYQIYFYPDGALENISETAREKVYDQILKYPNGIPNQNNRTYRFKVIAADLCAFNYFDRTFAFYVGTYQTQAGDVYSCRYEGTCFTEDTMINIPNGKKKISELNVNDEVIGFDENQILHTSKISSIYTEDNQPVYKVILENENIIKSTLSHPFLMENGEFRFLGDIKEGEYLVSYDKKLIKIKEIKFFNYEKVFNIKVKKYHTYIANDIFVHNRGGYRGPSVGTVQCSRGRCQQWNGRRWVPKGRYVQNRNYTLTSNSIPGNCHTLISRAGDKIEVNDFAYRFANDLKESKDIGITSLTNISILDVLGEGPIEGIVDYEIKPKAGYQKNDIGYRNGVEIVKYGGTDSNIRSIYWNEIPLADDTYPNPGSMNFEFIKIYFDNGDSAPRHTSNKQLKNLNIEEEFFSKKAQNGNYVPTLTIRDASASPPTAAFPNLGLIARDVKFPRKLTATKVVGSKLFGKRKFQDGTEKTYKKSITIMNKHLYGLKLHIKGVSLFKQIVDLSVWESASEAAENTTGGRVDRQVMTFNLYLKRIDKGSNNSGLVITKVLLGNKDYAELTMAGKLNQGAIIETFEWNGLTKSEKTGFNDKTIGWEIEIEPTFTESVDLNIIKKASIDSITEVYQDFLILPHTAAILTTFDSRFFQSIPQRAYDVRMLKVKIPSNYNPYSKTYEGIWDGRFKLGWTDNPAWCFYDLITNRRYGLGRYVDPNLTDKWTLYEIARYCDQLVSDGLGGLEPRFTCNVLISTREDAYKVLNDMASIFRGLVYYNAGLIFTSQDRPKDPIYLFNNTNVKDGEFTYSNTSKRVRRNVALVRYNDKENFFKPAVKYVENREGLIRFGIREVEVSAFGCTSEGQAERLGKWTLLSENLEAEVVGFETSLPAMYLKPGDIILVQDQNRQNKLLGGRTYELNKYYAILDVKYQELSGYLGAIKGCKLNFLTPAGNIEIGTETGNALSKSLENRGTQINYSIADPLYIENIGLVSGINTSLTRRKQIQTINYNTTWNKLNPDDLNPASLKDYVFMETGGNFQGFTKIYFGNQNLDETEHTLLQNTVWTLELDPEKYDHTKSPSISGLTDPTQIYPGAYLEPYIDKTQKFRVLDIEEQEEFRYKVTALEYNEEKYNLSEDI